MAWAADKGLNPADASATKVYGSEFALEAYRVLLEIVGQAGYLAEGSPGAVLGGHLEQRARGQTIFTFGGGTNEIQRDIIAWLGLGLPRGALSRSDVAAGTAASTAPGGSARAGRKRDGHGDSHGRRHDHRVRRHRRLGPVVVLAHGFLMDRSMFDDQVAVLADDYRFITWDTRDSARPSTTGDPSPTGTWPATASPSWTTSASTGRSWAACPREDSWPSGPPSWHPSASSA